MLKKSRNITIKDVAKEVCMSVSTVSRALSGSSNIAVETRVKIQEVADRLGYKPNQTALSLKQGYTHTIGVILPDMLDTFFYEIYRNINETLWKQGWGSFVVFSDEDKERELAYLQLMKKMNVDGIIMCVCDAEYNRKEIQSMINDGYKFVFFDRSPLLPNITRIEIDNENCMFFLVQKFIEQGYKKIAYIGSPDHLHYSKDRLNGYLQAVKKHNIYNKDLIFKSNGMRFNDGMELKNEIFERLDEIDAIVACDDLIAISVMHNLHKTKKRVPEDVAISGFGGSIINTMVVPEITTVEFPKKEIGITAANAILEKIMNERYVEKVINLKANVIQRESSIRKN